MQQSATHAAEWFDEWFNTPYYHWLYFQRDEQEAEAFIRRLVAYLNPLENSAMLDVACGRGRHSIFLNKMGYRVTGIDLAPDSIGEAKKFENEGLQFYIHDMRQPFWINYYDYVFNFFTSFGYFKSTREHYAGIRTMAHALKPHGRIVIDYLNVHYTEAHFEPSRDVAIGDFNFHITKWMDETHFYKRIEVEHDDFTEPHSYLEKVAKFSLGDFTEMLSYVGVQVKEVFGDYNLGHYDVKATPRMIIVGEKIKH